MEYKVEVTVALSARAAGALSAISGSMNMTEGEYIESLLPVENDGKARETAVSFLDKMQYWMVLAEVLHEMWYFHPDTADADLHQAVEDYVNDEPEDPSFDLITELEVDTAALLQAVSELDANAAREVYLAVAEFWETGEELSDWAKRMVESDK